MLTFRSSMVHWLYHLWVVFCVRSRCFLAELRGRTFRHTTARGQDVGIGRLVAVGRGAERWDMITRFPVRAVFVCTVSYR